MSNGFLEDLLRRRERATANGSLASVEARSRYDWIRRIVSAGVTRPETRVVTWTDRVDHFVTHKVYGTLIFVAIMAVVFQAIFTWAAPSDAVDLGWVHRAGPSGVQRVAGRRTEKFAGRWG